MNAQDRAIAAFRQRFQCAPAWGARAPGRVNLIGEHTDYNGGFVLPIAIDRDCVAVGAPAPGDSTRVAALDLGLDFTLDTSRDLRVVSGDPAAPNEVRRATPQSYIAGVLAQFQRRWGALPPLDIVIAGDVPIGGGLSSSASLEVAVATLLEAAADRRSEPLVKAAICRAAEHEFTGVPCGIMDQYISVLGKAGHALLIDCGDESARHVPMPPPDRAAVLVADSGVRLALAEGEYAQRRRCCELAAAKTGVTSLRQADAARLERAGPALTDQERRCARHVITENARTLRAAAALTDGDLDLAGRLMIESHASLRDDFRVSSPGLDTLVELADGAPGVFGARMTGGGFGGCAIALVDPAAAPELESRWKDGYRAVFRRECRVFRVMPADGAGMFSIPQ